MFSYNSVSVVIKVIVGLINSKLIAIYAGPTGMALLGNLKNGMSFVESIGTLGFQNGIVKYIAEYKNDKASLSKLISTVVYFLTGILVVMSLTIIVFADSIGRFVFGGSEDYTSIIYALGLALPWYALSVVFLSVINGYHQFKKVISINIGGNIIALVLSLVLVINYGVEGALYSLVVAPALVFVICIYYFNQILPWNEYVMWRSFDFSIIKKLLPYSLMFFLSAVLSPLVYLEIRNHVITVVGANSAGYWEAMVRVSTYVLIFASTLTSVYYYPKLAVLKSKRGVHLVFKSFYRWIVVGFGIAVVVVYLLKFLIIEILFTEAFLPVTDLFGWQLLGDFFKVSSMVLGYQFLARKMTVPFILTELLSLLIMFVSSFYFVRFWGLEGVVVAHALTYFVYWFILVLVFWKTIFYKKSVSPTV